MKKTYEEPRVEVVTFDTSDVITVSPYTELPPYPEEE